MLKPIKISLKKDFGSMKFKKTTDELMGEVDEGWD